MTDDSEQGRWVGLRVREERQRRGWTGATLAEKAGIAPNTVVAIEQGRRVRPGSIAKVRAALDLPVEERLEATGATCVLGILKGCSILRVHDVKPIARMARMTDAILAAEE